MIENLLLQDIRIFAQKCLQKNPGSHDWDHTLRVYQHALKLWEKEDKKGNLFIIQAAVYLHDIARAKDIVNEDGKKCCHAQQGAILAESYLKTLSLDESIRCSIVRAIATHRFRQQDQNLIPITLEEKIVFDADKLDSLGAVGIGRAFHFAGRIGARLHNSKEEALASTEFSLEDTAWREYLVKLNFLPKCMLTKSGRKLANERKKIMIDFFKQLNQECGYEQ